jgi:flagellar hook assembly protein FlgD
MRRPFAFIVAIIAAALAAPAAYGSGDARVVSVDLPVRGERSPASAAERAPFTLVGVHWRGPGHVMFRTRAPEGRWSEWRRAVAGDDAPDRGSPELRARKGWQAGNPFWVGPSDRIETRTVGRVTRVRAHLVWSPERGAPYRRVPYRRPASSAATEAPTIVPRVSWGADESIRRNQPSYAESVRFAMIHHTAGQNDYSRGEAAAIVRGIQLYHVMSNGWNDIGYNFLVDRFGTVYEGRFGGVERNVVGAHARGFNTGSTGIAVLGTHGSAPPSQAAMDAVARLVAWRLDLAHVDPAGLFTFVSGGSERFASGIPVLLRAVSGHRDTGFTTCPGDAFYGRLNALAVQAAQIGLPKIFEPRAETVEGLIRVRARLSSSAAWTVAVTDTAGLEVARGTGTGTAVDWTWDPAGAVSGSYRWTVRSGTARPASGPLRVTGGATALAIQSLTALPAAITPNGDGQGDTAAISYRLTAAANVTVEVQDGAGAVVATVVDRVWTRAGTHTATIDGAALDDGLYSVVVRARTPAGTEVENVVPLAVTRAVGLVAVTPSSFSPNGDGRNDRLDVSFSLDAPASVGIRIVREGRWVASPLNATYEAGVHRFAWNGARSSGRLRDGTYAAIVEVADLMVGPVAVTVPFVVDTTAPRVRILPGRPLRIEVSEPATLTLRIDGAIVRRDVKKAGIVRIRWSGAARRVRVVALDAAGNSSGPVVRNGPSRLNAWNSRFPLSPSGGT